MFRPRDDTWFDNDHLPTKRVAIPTSGRDVGTHIILEMVIETYRGVSKTPFHPDYSKSLLYNHNN